MEHSTVFASYTSKPWQPSQHDNPESIVRGLAPHFWKAALKLKRPESWDVEDLLQVALLAALECASRFDPSRGTPFGAYALTAGRRAMMDACIEGQGIMRIQSQADNALAEASRYAQRGAIRLDALTFTDDAYSPPNHDVVGDFSSIEDQVAIRQALAKMTPRSQEAFVSLVTEQSDKTSGADSMARKHALGRLVPKPSQPNKATGGVYFVTKRKRWCAQVTVNGKRKHVGYFDTEDAAMKAVKAARAA